VIIASSRGGIYSEGPAAAVDFQETYLKHVFGFIGIRDVEFVRAEGLNLGAQQRDAALARAHRQIEGELRVAA
jgi:FMN-dependent NADH-azoreductase